MFACGKFYSGCGSVLTKDQHNDKETFETTDLQTKYTIASLHCYSVLSDIWVKNELCIPLE